MVLDPLILSRLQFAWVVAWHILLPALTIGLASYIALLEGIHFLTGKEIWLRISSFWTKIFAIAFGMGVVSGVVMPFQFGTNWSRFSDATANIISPMLAYEGLTAFTLEAGFLGVLLFGRKLVPAWAHFASAVLVAAGTLFSTFWILVTNSWMQTPGGYKLIDGIFYPTDWAAIIFNASFPYRFLHTVFAFYVTTGFVVTGVAAYLLLRKKSVPEAKLMMSVTLWLLCFSMPSQILLGDLQGLNTLEHQPAKLAAIEAHWDREARAPLALFAIPDEKAEKNNSVIEVPLLGSLILTHDANGVVPGLKEFKPEDRPPVAVPFFAFRIMVGLGMIMLSMVVLGLLLRPGGRLYTTRWYLHALTVCAPMGFLAVIAGWTTTEVGRQPWTVYGVMRTMHSVTPSLTGWDVLISLAGYIAAYAVMFPAGAWLIMRIIRAGVTGLDDKPFGAGRPAEPVKPVPGAGP